VAPTRAGVSTPSLEYVFERLLTSINIVDILLILEYNRLLWFVSS
jgi:hypothetical protein